MDSLACIATDEAPVKSPGLSLLSAQEQLV